MFLLLVPTQVDRSGGKPGVDAPESRDRGVDARKLHGDEAVEEHAAADGAVSLVSDAANTERGDLRHDLVGKLVARPKVLDQGSDLGLHKGAHALDERAVAIGKKSSDLVEVSIGGRGRVFRAASRALDGQRTASLRVLVDNYFLLSTAP